MTDLNVVVNSRASKRNNMTTMKARHVAAQRHLSGMMAKRMMRGARAAVARRIAWRKQQRGSSLGIIYS